MGSNLAGRTIKKSPFLGAFLNGLFVEFEPWFDDQPPDIFWAAQAREGALAPTQSRINFCVPSHAGAHHTKTPPFGGVFVFISS